jgi:hypothetical protein
MQINSLQIGNISSIFDKLENLNSYFLKCSDARLSFCRIWSKWNGATRQGHDSVAKYLSPPLNNNLTVNILLYTTDHKAEGSKTLWNCYTIALHKKSISLQAKGFRSPPRPKCVYIYIIFKAFFMLLPVYFFYFKRRQGDPGSCANKQGLINHRSINRTPGAKWLRISEYLSFIPLYQQFPGRDLVSYMICSRHFHHKKVDLI